MSLWKTLRTVLSYQKIPMSQCFTVFGGQKPCFRQPIILFSTVRQKVGHRAFDLFSQGKNRLTYFFHRVSHSLWKTFIHTGNAVCRWPILNTRFSKSEEAWNDIIFTLSDKNTTFERLFSYFFDISKRRLSFPPTFPQPVEYSCGKSDLHILYIQIFGKFGVLLNEDTPRLHLVAHEEGEYFVTHHGIFNGHTKQSSRGGIHGRFP